jgi:spore germination protein GerM
VTAVRALLVAGLTVAVAVFVWVLFVGLPRWTAPRPSEPPPVVEAPAEATPRILARLYYLAPDGLRLQTAEREIDHSSVTAEQVRHLVAALLEPAPEPLLSVVPPGATLRNVYLSPNGTAFVDFSPEISRAHGGGSLDEIFTVYSVVNTVTDNLPAVTGVQILVDGREADTLAGHVDLRRPLQRNLRWAEPPAGGANTTAAQPLTEDTTPR